MNMLFNFLSGGLGDTASQLGIKSANANDIGGKVLPAIKSVGTVVGLLVAVGMIAIISVVIMIAKKQEQRSDAMTRILYVCIGILFLGLGGAIVGFVVNLV